MGIYRVYRWSLTAPPVKNGGWKTVLSYWVSVTFSDVKLRGGGILWQSENWQIFLFSRLLEDSKHPNWYDIFEFFGILQFSRGEVKIGKKTPKYPNVFLGWRIPPRTKWCSPNNPIKKFQKEKNINVVHLQIWNNYTSNFQNFRIPKCQVTSFQKTPGLVFFFQWNIYPSTHTGGVVVFRTSRTGLPRTHVVLFHRSHITWFFSHKVVVGSQPPLGEAEPKSDFRIERWEEVVYGKSRCFFFVEREDLKVW